MIERLTEFTDDLGAGIVLGAGGHMGSMPHWLVMKNTHLMAEEVIPHFREPDGKPSWMREEPLGARDADGARGDRRAAGAATGGAPQRQPGRDAAGLPRGAGGDLSDDRGPALRAGARRRRRRMRRAREAESEEDTKTHARRAERSEYLREKLEERARVRARGVTVG